MPHDGQELAEKLTQIPMVEWEGFLSKLDRQAMYDLEHALAAGDALLETALPSSSRLYVLRALGRYRVESALQQLAVKTKAGRPLARALPDVLTEALSTYQTINQEFPREAAWGDQAKLADQVRGLASMVPWPREAEAKAPYVWAAEIAPYPWNI